MERAGAEIRGLFQEICLQDLVLSLYGSYAPRLRDPEGRRLIESYLQSERDRRARIERYLASRGAPLSPLVRSLFAAAGTFYGRLTALFGTRFMLRTALSSSRRAARRACSLLEAERRPEIVYLTTLGARNEGDLVDKLRQHLIDTPRDAGKRVFSSRRTRPWCRRPSRPSAGRGAAGSSGSPRPGPPDRIRDR